VSHPWLIFSRAALLVRTVVNKFIVNTALTAGFFVRTVVVKLA